jgi:alpha-tubulin suppressor-like RCC1 family protein
MGWRTLGLLAALAATLTLVSCQSSAGGQYAVTFLWPEEAGHMPEDLWLTVRLEEWPGCDDAQATILGSAGPVRTGQLQDLVFPQVANGSDRVVVMEIRDGSTSFAQVMYYGFSDCFQVAPGETVDVPVAVQIQSTPGVTPTPETPGDPTPEGAYQVHVVASGQPCPEATTAPQTPLVNDPLVRLCLRGPGLNQALISNTPTFAQGEGTRCASLEHDDTCPGLLTAQDDGVATLEDWDLNLGLGDPCEDGDHCEPSVYLRFRDVHGYESPPFVTPVHLDRKAPQLLSCDAAPSFAKTGSTVVLSLAIDEPLSQSPQWDPPLGFVLDPVYEEDPDRNIWLFFRDVTDADPEGPQTSELVLTDKAGNDQTGQGCLKPGEETTTLFFVVDKTPPPIQKLQVENATLGPEVGPVAADGQQIQVSMELDDAQPDQSPVLEPKMKILDEEVTLTEQDGVWTGELTVNAAKHPHGPAPVLVQVLDEAGNLTSTSAALSFDLEEPKVLAASPSKLIYSGSDSIITYTLVFDEPVDMHSDQSSLEIVTEPAGEWVASIDGGQLVPDPGGTTKWTLHVPALPEGTFRPAGHVVDALGNVAQLPPNDLPPIVVDNTPPQITDLVVENLTLPEDVLLWLEQDEDADLPVAAADGDQVRVSFTLNEPPLQPPKVTCLGETAATEVQPGQWEATFTVDQEIHPEGPTSVVVQVADAATNIALESALVTLDYTPPQANLHDLQPEEVWWSQTSGVKDGSCLLADFASGAAADPNDIPVCFFGGLNKTLIKMSGTIEVSDTPQGDPWIASGHALDFVVWTAGIDEWTALPAGGGGMEEQPEWLVAVNGSLATSAEGGFDFFADDSLTEGSYTLELHLEDALGNGTNAHRFFVVTHAEPQAEVTVSAGASPNGALPGEPVSLEIIPVPTEPYITWKSTALKVHSYTLELLGQGADDQDTPVVCAHHYGDPAFFEDVAFSGVTYLDGIPPGEDWTVLIPVPDPPCPDAEQEVHALQVRVNLATLAGVVGEFTTAPLTLDGSPPEVTSVAWDSDSPFSDSHTNHANANVLRIEASDPSGMEVEITGDVTGPLDRVGTWVPLPGPDDDPETPGFEEILDLTDADGIKSVQVRLRDALGNTTVAQTATIVLDTVPPAGLNVSKIHLLEVPLGSPMASSEALCPPAPNADPAAAAGHLVRLTGATGAASGAKWMRVFLPEEGQEEENAETPLTVSINGGPCAITDIPIGDAGKIPETAEGSSPWVELPHRQNNHYYLRLYDDAGNLGGGFNTFMIPEFDLSAHRDGPDGDVVQSARSGVQEDGAPLILRAQASTPIHPDQSGGAPGAKLQVGWEGLEEAVTLPLEAFDDVADPDHLVSVATYIPTGEETEGFERAWIRTTGVDLWYDPAWVQGTDTIPFTFDFTPPEVDTDALTLTQAQAGADDTIAGTVGAVRDLAGPDLLWGDGEDKLPVTVRVSSIEGAGWSHLPLPEVLEPSSLGILSACPSGGVGTAESPALLGYDPVNHHFWCKAGNGAINSVITGGNPQAVQVRDMDGTLLESPDFIHTVPSYWSGSYSTSHLWGTPDGRLFAVTPPYAYHVDFFGGTKLWHHKLKDPWGGLYSVCHEAGILYGLTPKDGDGASQPTIVELDPATGDLLNAQAIQGLEDGWPEPERLVCAGGRLYAMGTSQERQSIYALDPITATVIEAMEYEQEFWANFAWDGSTLYLPPHYTLRLIPEHHGSTYEQFANPLETLTVNPDGSFGPVSLGDNQAFRVRLDFEDAAGNLTRVELDNDTAPPLLAGLTVSPSVARHGDAVQITVTLEDAHDLEALPTVTVVGTELTATWVSGEVEIGGAGPQDLQYTLTLDQAVHPEGLQNLVVSSQDTLGNQATYESESLTWDFTPPVSRLTWPLPLTGQVPPWNGVDALGQADDCVLADGPCEPSGVVSVEVSLEDLTAGTWLAPDGSPSETAQWWAASLGDGGATDTRPWSLSLPMTIDDGGSYRLWHRATDGAGNTSDASLCPCAELCCNEALCGQDCAPADHALTFEGKTTPPETTITEVPEAWADPSVFTFQCDDALGCIYECAIGDGPWETCTSPASYSGLGYGGHTFQVRARDIAGVWDPTPATHSWLFQRDWTQVSLGRNHTCAVEGGGTLWCWGTSTYGALGLGEVTESLWPAQVPHPDPALHWAQVSAGQASTCAIDSANVLWCWGENIGGGSSTPQSTCPEVQWASVALEKATSGAGACGLTTDGAVRCWGSASELDGVADGDPKQTCADAGSIDQPGPWASIWPGVEFSCAIHTDGDAWCWGHGDSGQLGDGLGIDSDAPVKVDDQHLPEGQWTSITGGDGYACGTRDDGSLWCWGAAGSGGQTGLGQDLVPSLVWAEAPADVPTNWSAVVAGVDQLCGVSDGGLYCWGCTHEAGGLGTGVHSDCAEESPVQHLPEKTWTGVRTDPSSDRTCAVTADGGLWCWGGVKFNSGEGAELLGLGVQPTYEEPQQVMAGTKWLEVSTGGRHTCALDNGGQVWCWGGNATGLALPGAPGEGPDYVIEPTLLGSVGGAFGIAAGPYTTSVLNSEGELTCWGESCPTVGDGPWDLWGITNAGRFCLVDFSGTLVCPGSGLELPATPGGWKSLYMGADTACALTVGDQLYCWGKGDKGQLGDASPDGEALTEATPVFSDIQWSDISVGSDVVCGIQSADASLWCWGDLDPSPNFGSGISGIHPEPVAVAPGHAWKSIGHLRGFESGDPCGIQTDGSLWCWSDGAPHEVAPGTAWTQVAVGGPGNFIFFAYNCGIQTDQSLWCWGNDAYGQLGIRDINWYEPNEVPRY